MCVYVYIYMLRIIFIQRDEIFLPLVEHLYPNKRCIHGKQSCSHTSSFVFFFFQLKLSFCVMLFTIDSYPKIKRESERTNLLYCMLYVGNTCAIAIRQRLTSKYPFLCVSSRMCVCVYCIGIVMGR